MLLVRATLSMLMGAFITVSLFYVMQALIQSGMSVIQEEASMTLVDFVRLKQDPVLETKKRKPKKPPPPDEPPPDIKPQLAAVAFDKTGYSMAPLNVAVTVDVSGGGFGMGDGEYLPIVKVRPNYPQRALTRGLEGWVILEYTVTAQGTVRDASVVANCAMTGSVRNPGECDDHPSNIFDLAAIKAALKFKYKPKVIDGVAVDTSGVQHKITFVMVDA